jgi:putative transposase
MGKQKWTGQQKLQIVLEGLKGGSSIAELCNRHQVSQAQYYKWRDRLLQQGGKVFEFGGTDAPTQRLSQRIRELEQTVGQLHVELKKSDGGLW